MLPPVEFGGESLHIFLNTFVRCGDSKFLAVAMNSSNLWWTPPHSQTLKSHVPWSKVAILGMVIPPFNRNPYNGYINPYYWVDDHPLLYGNNGSLDPGTHWYLQFFCLWIRNLQETFELDCASISHCRQTRTVGKWYVESPYGNLIIRSLEYQHFRWLLAKLVQGQKSEQFWVDTLLGIQLILFSSMGHGSHWTQYTGFVWDWMLWMVMPCHASLHEVLNFPEFPPKDATIIPWMRGHCEEYGDFWIKNLKHFTEGGGPPFQWHWNKISWYHWDYNP